MRPGFESPKRKISVCLKHCGGLIKAAPQSYSWSPKMPKKVPKSEKILGKPEDTRSFSKYFDGPPDNFIKANQATQKLDLTCNLF